MAVPTPPPPAGTRRRRARLAAWTLGAAAVLAASAALSVGIAWWQEWRYQQMGGAARTTLGTFNSRYSPAHTATWGDPWPTIPTTLVSACNIIRVEPERRAHFSSWLANAEPPGWLALPTDDALFRQTIASGWPRRCMRRTLHKDAVTEHALRAGPSLTLPTGVYLPGMAANTAFFAAGFTLLVVAPIAALRRLRTLHRRRRFRCVGCGYPMGYGPLDAACPECGRIAGDLAR